jgi:hypothetical protein
LTGCPVARSASPTADIRRSAKSAFKPWTLRWEGARAERNWLVAGEILPWLLTEESGVDGTVGKRGAGSRSVKAAAAALIAAEACGVGPAATAGCAQFATVVG